MAIESEEDNTSKQGLRGNGVIRKTVASTNDGIAVVLHSTRPILVASWRIDNRDLREQDWEDAQEAADPEDITYDILGSKEHQPDPNDPAAWDVIEEDTALGAAVGAGEDNKAHYTSLMAVIYPAVDGTQSERVRVILAGSV